jgi:hypothetical protein
MQSSCSCDESDPLSASILDFDTFSLCLHVYIYLFMWTLLYTVFVRYKIQYNMTSKYKKYLNLSHKIILRQYSTQEKTVQTYL